MTPLLGHCCCARMK